MVPRRGVDPPLAGRPPKARSLLLPAGRRACSHLDPQVPRRCRFPDGVAKPVWTQRAQRQQTRSLEGAVDPRVGQTVPGGSRPTGLRKAWPSPRKGQRPVIRDGMWGPGGGELHTDSQLRHLRSRHPRDRQLDDAVKTELGGRKGAGKGQMQVFNSPRPENTTSDNGAAFPCPDWERTRKHRTWAGGRGRGVDGRRGVRTRTEIRQPAITALNLCVLYI